MLFPRVFLMESIRTPDTLWIHAVPVALQLLKMKSKNTHEELLYFIIAKFKMKCEQMLSVGYGDTLALQFNVDILLKLCILKMTGMKNKIT